MLQREETSRGEEELQREEMSKLEDMLPMEASQAAGGGGVARDAWIARARWGGAGQGRGKCGREFVNKRRSQKRVEKT